jgi:4-amino-4-deoxy-L-arabinose transferase-like glycosyltransferase
MAWKDANWGAWLKHAWLLPILAVALWLRLAGITQHHLYGDEAEYSIVARYLSRDWTFLSYPGIDPYSTAPFVSQPPLLLYVTALFMRVLGATDVAALLPPILFGAATVAVVYALGNRLGGRFVGLSAAAVLAVLPFHIQMSRRAMLDAGFVFFLLLTTYFLVRWTQTRTRGAALGLGLAAAGTALAKLPGVLILPVALIVFVVALGIVIARRARGLATNRDVGETLLQGGLGIGPVLLGGFLYLALLWKMQAVSNLWVKLTWQMGRVDTSNAQFVDLAQQTRDWTWYLSDPKFSFAALFGGAILVLGLIGLGVGLARFVRHPVKRLDHLVLPLAVFVIGGFFFYSARKEGFYLLPFAPFFALGVGLAGSALRDLLAWANIRLSRDSAPRLAPLAIAVAILLVAVPAYGAASSSYHTFALGESNEKYLGEGTKEAADYIHAHSPDAIQYGTLLGRFTLYWYNEQPAYHWYVDHTFVESQIASGHLKYVVKDNYIGLTFDDQLMDDLINQHHGKLVQEYRHGWGKVQVFELTP